MAGSREWFCMEEQWGVDQISVLRIMGVKFLSVNGDRNYSEKETKMTPMVLR